MVDRSILGFGIRFLAPAASTRAEATSSRFVFFEDFTMRQFPDSSLFIMVTLIECWSKGTTAQSDTFRSPSTAISLKAQMSAVLSDHRVTRGKIGHGGLVSRKVIQVETDHK